MDRHLAVAGVHAPATTRNENYSTWANASESDRAPRAQARSWRLVWPVASSLLSQFMRLILFHIHTIPCAILYHIFCMQGRHMLYNACKTARSIAAYQQSSACSFFYILASWRFFFFIKKELIAHVDDRVSTVIAQVN